MHAQIMASDLLFEIQLVSVVLGVLNTVGVNLEYTVSVLNKRDKNCLDHGK